MNRAVERSLTFHNETALALPALAHDDNWNYDPEDAQVEVADADDQSVGETASPDGDGTTDVRASHVSRNDRDHPQPGEGSVPDIRISERSQSIYSVRIRSSRTG